MIGNPYPFAIDWQVVIDYNASKGINIEKLVTYKNRKFDSNQSIMNEFDGALINSFVDVEIEIPISAKLNSSGRTGVSDKSKEDMNSDNWSFGLAVENGVLQYNVSSIGMRNDASEGRDQYDWSMLPRLSNYLDISFDGALTRSIVPVRDVFTWSFFVNGQVEGSTQLKWNNSSLRESNYSMILLDVVNNKLVDMESIQSYEFNLTGQNQAFKIFYASKSEISSYLELSSDFIGEPFPNPYATDINVPVYMSGDNLIFINIYDISGKLVYQSEYSKMKNGYQEINVNMESITIAGTYFIQITLSSDGHVTRSMNRVVHKR